MNALRSRWASRAYSAGITRWAGWACRASRARGAGGAYRKGICPNRAVIDKCLPRLRIGDQDIVKFIQFPTVVDVEEQFATACVDLDNPTKEHRVRRGGRTGSREAACGLAQINIIACGERTSVDVANRAEGRDKTFCAVGNALSRNAKSTGRKRLGIRISKRNAWPLPLCADNRDNLALGNNCARAVVAKNDVFLTKRNVYIAAFKAKVQRAVAVVPNELTRACRDRSRGVKPDRFDVGESSGVRQRDIGVLNNRPRGAIPPNNCVIG